MTDKQIIIDGVDVSGCDFLAKEDDYCSYSGITYAYKGQCMCSDEEMCKEHPKCFYKKVLKQAKAKEQECERLKVNSEEQSYRYAELDADYICLQDKVGKLERAILRRNDELDQLKAENETKQKALELQKAWIDNLEFQRTKLKQTLTEIITFFKEDKKFARYSGYPIIFTSSALEKIEKILNKNDIKINEVE